VSRTKEGDCRGPGLPDFSLFDIPKHGEIYQIVIKIPNGNKIHRIAVIYSKWAENIPTFLFQGLPKLTQIWIFGLKKTSGNPAMDRNVFINFPIKAGRPLQMC
jgi:hypothetical protein